MELRIKKGSEAYLEACEEALLDSELGRQYFFKEGTAKEAVLEGLEEGTLYVALIKNDFVGFFYYLKDGAFHSFPYLHLFVIKKEHRSKGIGKVLLKAYEDLVFQDAKKTFLVVADFNLDAKRFYEREGYMEVGAIPSLYRENITEYLLHKRRP